MVILCLLKNHKNLPTNKLVKLNVSGEGAQSFSRGGGGGGGWRAQVLMLIPMETYSTCKFLGVLDPVTMSLCLSNM